MPLPEATLHGAAEIAVPTLVLGERDSAARHVREAWRSEELSERSEAEAFEMFRDLLTSDDHRARMDKRIGAKDFSGALRSARHLGSGDCAGRSGAL